MVCQRQYELDDKKEGKFSRRLVCCFLSTSSNYTVASKEESKEEESFYKKYGIYTSTECRVDGKRKLAQDGAIFDIYQYFDFIFVSFDALTDSSSRSPAAGPFHGYQGDG